MNLNGNLVAIDELYAKLNISYGNNNRVLYEYWLNKLSQTTISTMEQYDLTFSELCKLSNGNLRIMY